MIKHVGVGAAFDRSDRLKMVIVTGFVRLEISVAVGTVRALRMLVVVATPTSAAE